MLRETVLKREKAFRQRPLDKGETRIRRFLGENGGNPPKKSKKAYSRVKTGGPGIT